MATKSKTVHVVELKANAERLQEALASLKESFNGLVLPKDLDAAFGKLDGALEAILRKTKKGVIPREDLQSTKKELTKVKNGFESLSGSIESIQKVGNKKLSSMLPSDVVAKINEAKKAYDAYANTLLNVAAAEKAVAEAREKLQAAEDKVKSATNSERAYKGKVTAAEGELAKHKEITEALVEQAEATSALAKAEKELEKARSSGKGEKAIANRTTALTAAQTRKREADEKVNAFNQQDKDAQKKAEERVRVAREKYEAAKKKTENAKKSQTAAEIGVQNASTDLAQAQKARLQNIQNENEALTKLKLALEAVNPKFKEITIEGDNTADQLEFLKRIIDGLSDEELAKLKIQLQKVDKNFEAAEEQLNNTRDAYQAVTEAVKENDEALAQQQAFEDKIKQFLGLTGAVHVLRSALRDAMQTIKELDATMTEMAVVTELSVGDYWDQLPEYSKRASELGVSINEVYKSATLYYQQGLKANEVTELSTETLKMARIAGLSAEDATNKMTAALRGFNMELNETNAQKIADVYSELAAITAADTKEISNAMTKTASIASSAGMEFETTAAFLSQIIETTRESAETAGTAMKTIVARFQELKKDPSEIGEVDGEIVDANKIETALRSVGVSLRDANGQFRDLDEVFLELSSKWNTLDKNTQRYIATIAAGSRQQSRFIAMMSDYNRTQELVTAANNSAGASQKQFEKTLESLSAKLEKLKNAWHEFTMGILDSDLVKLGVDILTKFLEVVNKATSALDGIGGSLVKIISVVSVFKIGQKVFQKLMNPIRKFFLDIIKEAHAAGENSGKAFKDGLEKAKNSGDNKNQSQPSPQSNQNTGENNTNQSKTFLQSIGDKTGITNIKEGITAGKEERKEYKQNLEQLKKNKANVFDAEVSLELVSKTSGKDSQDFLETQQELNKAQQEYEQQLEKTNQSQKKYFEAGYEGSKKLGQGMISAGQAAMGVGVAISALGGILSELGLEEVGEGFATVGNYIMILGSAITALGPIITAVSNLAKAQGISTLAAWGWVGLIVAGVALLAAGIIAIFKQIENNSPEKKLEKAQQAAEGAAQGAKQAAEAYDKLSDSINNLDQQYDKLEGLKKGTEEWNKAVQEVNSSVLDLINQYPELAGLVENDGRVLTLDVDSKEVQSVINSYKKDSIMAQGASLGAKANLARAQAEYDLSKMDDSVFEKFQTDGQGAAIWTAIGNTAASTAIGAASGAAIGAGVGALAGGVGAAPGAGIGAIAGGIAGLTAGIASFKYTVDQVEKNNEQNRENVKTLAKAYANGETGTTIEEISDYIERNGIAMGEAADEMAQSLLDEAAILKEYGDTLNAVEQQEKVYYQAMAANAQQLVDAGSYTESEMNQMTNVVDEDLMKAYEDSEKERLKELDKDEFEQEKEDYAKQIYGENARVDGNKIIDEKGEVVREFTDDEQWVNEMAAANATLKAAQAMEQIPGAISNAVKAFDVGLQGAIAKAFEGKDLTKKELEDFNKAVNDKGFTYKDADGNTAKSWEELSEKEKKNWSSKENYLNSLDKDYHGIEEAWNKLTAEQRAAYNNDYEQFEASWLEISKAQTEAWAKAEASAKKFGITLSEQLSSSAAQAWTSSLEEISFGAAEGEINNVNESLNELLKGMTAQEAELVMAEINAMDKMDIDAWDGLGQALDDLNIDYNVNALNKLTESGKLAYNAIDKINFDTLAEDINNIYKTINKVKEGGRTYSEEDYKEIIAANKSLEKSFTQIGDEFIYVGGSMEDLIVALEKNTVAKLNEANRQLKTRSEMSAIIDQEQQNYGSVNAMGNIQLMNYLTDMREKFAQQNLDIADFGIAGLSGTTDFSKASEDQLRTWAAAIAGEGGKSTLYENEYKEGLQKANIQRFTNNDSAYNARMAVEGGEFAKQHQEALILQGIQSGGVNNQLIEEYKQAIESGNTDLIRSLGQKISDAADKIVEESAGRDAYQELIDRVTEAIEKNTQKEIDELSNIYDSINSTNEKLLNKIQEQINYQREQEATEEAKDNIADLYSKQAYLSMDTSGSNALEIKKLDEEIEEEEKSLQETYVDQALQNLSDANERAAEQRETQINILQSQLESQLENGAIAEQAAGIVKDSIEELKTGTILEETKMGRLLFGAEAANLGELASKEWTSDLQKSAVLAQNWLTQQMVDSGNVTGMEETLGSDNVQVKEAKQQRISNALESAKRALTDASGGGFIGQKDDENSEFRQAYKAYTEATGDHAISFESFAQKAAGAEYNKYDFKIIGKANKEGNNWNWNDVGDSTETEQGGLTINGDDTWRGQVTGPSNYAKSVVSRTSNGDVFQYGEWTYLTYNGEAYWLEKLKHGNGKWKANTSYQFKTGGLADFTGPAWLDGTKSRPEYVLNAAQTEKFFSLIDVLEKYDENKTTNKPSGDNYFEIQINVDELKDDYDVEQLANKIRSMIYEDATYRNVNAVSHLR